MNIKLSKTISKALKNINMDFQKLSQQVANFLENLYSPAFYAKALFYDAYESFSDRRELHYTAEEEKHSFEEYLIITSIYEKDKTPNTILVPASKLDDTATWQTKHITYPGIPHTKELNAYGRFLQQRFQCAGYDFYIYPLSTGRRAKLANLTQLYEVNSLDEAIKTVDYLEYKATGRFANFGLSKKGHVLEDGFSDSRLNRDTIEQSTIFHSAWKERGKRRPITAPLNFDYKNAGRRFINYIKANESAHYENIQEQTLAAQCNANRAQILAGPLRGVKPAEKYRPYNVSYPQEQAAQLERNAKRFETLVTIASRAGKFVRKYDEIYEPAFEEAIGKAITYNNLGYAEIDKTIENFSRRIGRECEEVAKRKQTKTQAKAQTKSTTAEK